ncbi:MAG: DEAD/DEAH box helicase [Erysipelothrix sp.]|nr:DEAD/DEAH box helicase [Erysipelothrix sp.]
MSNINKHSFSDKVLKFLQVNEFSELTPIQDKVIGSILKGEDVIAVSDTGTGKTHAFLIPILEKIDSSEDRVQAVITAPTRELAMQLYDFAKVMNEVDDKIKIELVTGGMDREKMASKLASNPHVVIGTPGRIKDMFVDQGILRIDQADFMVIDEADMTFEFGFLDEVDNIVSRMKKDVHMAVFSATIPKDVNKFLDKYMTNPKTVRVETAGEFSPNIDHVLISTKHKKYEQTLADLLKTINPYVCLIFANTRNHASETAEYLRGEGYKILEIHGGLTSRERTRAHRDLQSHDFTYIVASDIAARGLDIEGITHVISLGLPSDLNFYTHRSGRTGRTKRHGTSYIIYSKQDLNAIYELRNRGLEFSFAQTRNSELVPAKSIFTVRKPDYTEDIEIGKILNRKNVKVKPGYKKKRKQEIDRIKSQRRRAMIKDNIKEAQKERGKKRQIAKKKGK